LGWGCCAEGRTACAEDSAPPLFERIVVLGASIGAGFDCTTPFGGPQTREYQFSHYLEAALVDRHQPIVTHANVVLFLNATHGMETQIAATIAAKPSLVIGLDALFWFCYGSGREPEQRTEFFEAGLRFLERVDVPLVVGDLPDASAAVGRVLSPAQMPPIETLEKCNERLKRWAAARGNVTIFPLAELMARASKDEALTLGDQVWEAGRTRALLQRDLLHPARHGLAALAIATLEAARPKPSELRILRDAEAVYAAALERARTPGQPQ
jgi:hypothetical protein